MIPLDIRIEWLAYLHSVGVMTDGDARRLSGRIGGDPQVIDYASTMAKKYPDHLSAFFVKRRILGGVYEPE